MIAGDQLIHFVVSGIVLFLFWVFCLGVAWLGARVWEWIDDDDEEISNNPLVGFLLKFAGFRHNASWGSFYEKTTITNGREYYARVDGANFAGIIGAVLFFGPMILGLTLLFPTTASVIALTIFVVFMARSGRRLFKRFERHVDDKNAHK